MCRATVDQCDDYNSYCINRQCQCRANFTSQATEHCCMYICSSSNLVVVVVVVVIVLVVGVIV